MERIEVMIVDDSRISCAMLESLLARTNFDICCTARTAADAVEMYERYRPQVVTMDMNLPDANGIECSRRLKKLDKNVKIVMISAMRDEKLMEDGRAAGISDFLQKPVRTNQLVDILTKLCAKRQTTADIYRTTHARLFSEALRSVILGFTQADSLISLEERKPEPLTLSGIAVIVGLTGSPSGRIILHTSGKTMIKFATAFLNKKKPVDDTMAIETLEEAANIIIGRGVSLINDADKDNEMRITPPGALVGSNIRIAEAKLVSFRAKAVTPFGDIEMDMGFSEGE